MIVPYVMCIQKPILDLTVIGSITPAETPTEGASAATLFRVALRTSTNIFQLFPTKRANRIVAVSLLFAGTPATFIVKSQKSTYPQR